MRIRIERFKNNWQCRWKSMRCWWTYHANSTNFDQEKKSLNWKFARSFNGAIMTSNLNKASKLKRIRN
jgi:hypothetical protein